MVQDRRYVSIIQYSLISIHISLVPKSVTTNDLEQRNDFILHYFVELGIASRAHYVKVIENILNFLRQKCSPMKLVLAYIIYGDICRGSSSARTLK